MLYTVADVKNRCQNKITASNLPTEEFLQWCGEIQNEISWLLPLNQTERTFSTSIGTRDYGIDTLPGGILSMVNVTESMPIIYVSPSELELVDSDLSDSGSVTNYTSLDLMEVQRQPSAASQITVVSSSALDSGGSYKILLRGLVSGVDDYEQLTLTGVASVTSTKSFTEIYGCRKNTRMNGTITVSAGATTLVNIPAESLRAEYQKIRLYANPSSVISIRERHIRKPQPVLNDSDIFDVPECGQMAVLKGMFAKAHEYVKEYTMAKQMWIDFYATLKNLRGKLGYPADYIAVKGGTQFAMTWPRWPSNY